MRYALPVNIPFEMYMASENSVLRRFALALSTRPELAIVALMVIVIAMLLIPLPTPLIDMFIAVNIVISLLIFVGAFYVKQLLEFSSFPSLLLLTTIFRLALSISTSRQILLQADAGRIVETFGDFVIGGDLVIGFVIFAIVTLVQFIVITKGSERVAEVCARFSLDGMPGKQMSIDADLRAGVIDADQARERRAVLEKESQLFGAMDGSMKFIKGDAIAGIIIIFVNFIGGISIGMSRLGFTFSEAVDTYTLLTIGDGLVAQLPALLIALGAGFVVTRVSGETESLGKNVVTQFTANNFVILVVACLSLMIGLLPGFPLAAFAAISAGFGLLYWTRRRRAHGDQNAKPDEKNRALPNTSSAAKSGDVSGDEFDLSKTSSETIPMLALTHPDNRAEMESMDLPAVLQQRAFVELGLRLPKMQLQFDENQARNKVIFMINEVMAGPCHVVFGKACVSQGAEQVHAMGLPLEEVRDAAKTTYWASDEVANLPNVALRSASDVIVDQMLTATARNISESFGIQETKDLLDGLEEKYPELLKEAYRHATVQRIAEVLQRLIRESISIRNMKVILDAISQWAPKERDTVMLVENVRCSLARYISAKFSRNGELRAFVMSADVEDTIRGAIRQTAGGTFLNLDGEKTEMILGQLAERVRTCAHPLRDVTVVCAVDIRCFVKRLIEGRFPELEVLSFGEIAEGVSVNVVDSI